MSNISVGKAWSPPSQPERSVHTSLNRRAFVTSAAVGSVAILDGLTSSRSAAAAETPSALDLVEPKSMNGKVVVITGASTGIGLESAKSLAKAGATVVLTSRTESKGQMAVSMVQDFLRQEGIENSKVSYVQLDLDSLDNVKSFPSRFESTVGKESKIDVLMNNAGVMALPDLQLTKDGYERTFQSNHLGHFALTAKLVPFLSDSARVINVSSLAYTIASKGLDLDNLNGERDFGPWSSYGQSKLENILFTQELQRRADAAGIPLVATSLHPGAVNTDLARNMMGGDEVWYEKKSRGPSNFFENVVQATINKALLTPEQGAATQVYLATANSELKGRFYSDLKPQKLPSFAMDESKAKELWEKSEQLADIQFSLK